MFPHLPPVLTTVCGTLFVLRLRRFPGVFRTARVFRVAGTMMLVQLLGSVGSLEFMAFTGNARQRNSHKQQGKQFHRRVS